MTTKAQLTGQVANKPIPPKGGTAPKEQAAKTQTEENAGKVDPTVVPKYTIGKKYAGGTDRNKASYAKLTEFVKDGPKTLAELKKHLEDHKDFVGYMQRGGHLVIAAPSTTAN